MRALVESQAHVYQMMECIALNCTGLVIHDCTAPAFRPAFVTSVGVRKTFA